MGGFCAMPIRARFFASDGTVAVPSRCPGMGVCHDAVTHVPKAGCVCAIRVVPSAAGCTRHGTGTRAADGTGRGRGTYSLGPPVVARSDARGACPARDRLLLPARCRARARVCQGWPAAAGDLCQGWRSLAARLSRFASLQVRAYAGFLSRLGSYPAAGESASFSPFLRFGLGSTLRQWLVRSSCARRSAASAASVVGRCRKS